MKDFCEMVNDFLNELSHYTGRPPVFSIDYPRKKLIVVDSPSSFITQLAKDNRWLLSLETNVGLVLGRFKD